MPELKDKDEQYRELLNYREITEKGKMRFIITLRSIFLTFFIFSSTILIMHIITNYDDISSIINKFTNRELFGVKISANQDLVPSRFNFKMLNKYQNILILGVDSNGPNTLPFEGVRSDSIIILNIDNNLSSINAISIPRDSKVYIADGHGVQKINSAYAIGGIELTKKTIEETLGIKIHNYIVVNAEGIRKFIDTIGGVPVYIDHSMHYDDFSAGLHIHFPKGNYILDGEKAEGYLRFRKDILGDIGRVHRQQKFIHALIEKIKSPETLKKIPETLKIVNLYSRTDLSLYQMSQYAAFINNLDLNKVEFVVLPGAPNKKGIISYWILDPEKTQKIVNRLIYRQKNEYKDINVGIMYARHKETDAMILREELKNAGYEVNCTGKSSQINKSQIIGYNTSVSDNLVHEMKRKIPKISDYQYIHNTVRNFCDTSDIVITIEEDR